MPFKTEEEKDKTSSKISDILKDCYPHSEKFQQRNLDILLLLVARGVTTTNFALSSAQITETLIKYPRPSVCFSLKSLEYFGFVDRRTRNEGWFLSHSFLNRLEKLRGNWRDVLKVAES